MILPKDANKPISGGTGPDRKLFEIVRFSIAVKLPTSAGTKPENVLKDISRCSVTMGRVLGLPQKKLQSDGVEQYPNLLRGRLASSMGKGPAN